MRDISGLVSREQSRAEKLSSTQDFSILDSLLANAVAPLEAETDVYLEWVGEVIAHCVASRRKQNDRLLKACFDNLVGVGYSRDIIEAGIDRELVFSFLKRATDAGATLERVQMEYSRRRSDRTDIRHLTELKNCIDLLGSRPLVSVAARTAAYWYGLALSHKEGIIRHYLRLLLKVSSRASHASGGRIELGAAFGDAYVAADMATNRFRADCGVFASYLGSYLKGSSRVSASNALGLAAPGARVLSADALQADTIDGVEITDHSAGVNMEDDFTVRCVDAIAFDPDVRAALVVSDVESPAAAALRASSKLNTNATRRA